MTVPEQRRAATGEPPAAEWAEASDVRAALDRAEAAGRPADLIELIRDMVATLERSIPANTFATLGLERAAAKAARSQREEVFERRKGPAVGHAAFRMFMLNRRVYPCLRLAAEAIAEGGSGGYAKALVDVSLAAAALAHVVEQSDLRALVVGTEKLRLNGADLRRKAGRDAWKARARKLVRRHLDAGTPGWGRPHLAARKLFGKWSNGEDSFDPAAEPPVAVETIQRAIRDLYDGSRRRPGRPRKN